MVVEEPDLSENICSMGVTADTECHLGYKTGSPANSVDSIIPESPTSPTFPNEAIAFVADLMSAATILHSQCINLQQNEVYDKLEEFRHYLLSLTQSISPAIELKTFQNNSCQTTSKETSNIDTQTDYIRGKNVATQSKIVVLSKKVQTQIQSSSINTQTDRYHGKNVATQSKIPSYSKKVQTQIHSNSIETQTKRSQGQSVSTQCQLPVPSKQIKTEPIETLPNELSNNNNIEDVVRIVEYSDSEESETLSAIYEEVHRSLNSETEPRVKEEPISDSDQIRLEEDLISYDSLSSSEDYLDNIKDFFSEPGLFYVFHIFISY